MHVRVKSSTCKGTLSRTKGRELMEAPSTPLVASGGKGEWAVCNSVENMGRAQASSTSITQAHGSHSWEEDVRSTLRDEGG